MFTVALSFQFILSHNITLSYYKIQNPLIKKTSLIKEASLSMHFCVKTYTHITSRNRKLVSSVVFHDHHHHNHTFHRQYIAGKRIQILNEKNQYSSK